MKKSNFTIYRIKDNSAEYCLSPKYLTKILTNNLSSVKDTIVESKDFIYNVTINSETITTDSASEYVVPESYLEGNIDDIEIELNCTGPVLYKISSSDKIYFSGVEHYESKNLIVTLNEFKPYISEIIKNKNLKILLTNDVGTTIRVSFKIIIKKKEQLGQKQVFIDDTIYNVEDIDFDTFSNLIFDKISSKDTYYLLANSVIAENTKEMILCLGSLILNNKIDEFKSILNDKKNSSYEKVYNLIMKSNDTVETKDNSEITISTENMNHYKSLLMFSNINKTYVDINPVLENGYTNISTYENLLPYSYDYALPASKYGIFYKYVYIYLEDGQSYPGISGLLDKNKFETLTPKELFPLYVNGQIFVTYENNLSFYKNPSKGKNAYMSLKSYLDVQLKNISKNKVVKIDKLKVNILENFVPFMDWSIKENVFKDYLNKVEYRYMLVYNDSATNETKTIYLFKRFDCYNSYLNETHSTLSSDFVSNIEILNDKTLNKITYGGYCNKEMRKFVDRHSDSFDFELPFELYYYNGKLYYSKEDLAKDGADYVV